MTQEQSAAGERLVLELDQLAYAASFMATAAAHGQDEPSEACFDLLARTATTIAAQLSDLFDRV